MMFAQMTMDRPTMGAMPGMTPGAGTMPNMSNLCMVPRCTMKMEKCKDGMKMTCTCEDEMACATLQNLCKMLCDGLCSCVCVKNGMAVCQCSMAMCHCKCTNTPDGVCVTCTCGDKACCEMLQACCDCMNCCMEAGCMCCLCFGGTPVCCGTC